MGCKQTFVSVRAVIPYCIYTVHVMFYEFKQNHFCSLELLPCKFTKTWIEVQGLTGHSEGDLLSPATRLVLSHTSVGARVSFLGGAKHQIQAILVHSALCGYPLSSSLPPHFGLRSPPWGVTGHPLQRVCHKDARRPWRHVIYLCNTDTEQGLES